MKDEYTGEYRCPRCDIWHDKPGICGECQLEVEMDIDRILEERE